MRARVSLLPDLIGRISPPPVRHLVHFQHSFMVVKSRNTYLNQTARIPSSESYGVGIRTAIVIAAAPDLEQFVPANSSPVRVGPSPISVLGLSSHG